MSRRKPRHYSWLQKVRGGFVSAGGMFIPKESVDTWDSKEKKRMSRLDRRAGKREARASQD